MTVVRFWKMHGLGNDFIVTDARDYDLGDDDWRRLAVDWCERHTGIGADGLILVQPSDVAAVRMEVVNADGSVPEMCGNGIRCLAKFLIDTHRLPEEPFDVETGAGVLRIEPTIEQGVVTAARVAMGAPRFEPDDIPVDPAAASNGTGLHTATVSPGSRPFQVALVSMGNPHAIAFIDEPVEEFALETIGPLVEHDPIFPKRTNFEIVNRREDGLYVRVWERGAGPTLACGTGACAVMVADHLLQAHPENTMAVHLPGGRLDIEWNGEGPVYMTGPALLVYEGTTDV